MATYGRSRIVGYLTYGTHGVRSVRSCSNVRFVHGVETDGRLESYGRDRIGVVRWVFSMETIAVGFVAVE